MVVYVLNYSTYCLQWDRQLVLYWDSRLLLSWARGFSQGHLVDFQFLDNEEKLMTMRNSNTVMPTYGIEVAWIWLELFRLVLLYYRGA